ncbi:NADAR family protein [Bradyrhizobium sp. Bra64]|uniref:NADAR family protein n=1 Tax=Bradyrhizobium sp. Bra64 TaxID=2926009 RepID=UPI00211871EC
MRSLSSGKKSKVTSATNEEAIKFYRANERPYGIFSNLFRCEIEFEGKTYPTAEHAYQAGKALKPAVRDWILAAPTPSLAAMAAHGLYVWDVVPNWQSIKFDRMRAVLRAKFLQHPDIASVLLSTGSARLVEAGRVNNAVNRLWGEVNGQGQNMLGLMLMELRAELSARGTPSKVRSKETKAADNKRKNKRGSGQQRKTK